MGKTIFKDNKGNIHFGINAPSSDFKKAAKTDVEKTLASLGSRKLWRCTVCNDLCINIQPPKLCPTCFQTDAYVEIELNEFKRLMDIL
jgi:rubrerythrin